VPNIEKPVMIWECVRCGQSRFMDWRVAGWQHVHCRVCGCFAEGALVQNTAGAVTKWVCWTCGWLFDTALRHCRTCNGCTDGVKWRWGLTTRWTCLVCGAMQRGFRIFDRLDGAVASVSRWHP
jgi:hypothetical protein